MTDPVRLGPERRSTGVQGAATEGGNDADMKAEEEEDENEGGVGTGTEENLVLKKMKKGEIDPSKAIPADAVSLALPGAGKAKKASKDKNVTRLTHLKDQLSESKTLSGVVEDIQVSADDMKLIFRGKGAEEAFLFVIFGATEEAGHHAVVKSEDDRFRATVLEAIANL